VGMEIAQEAIPVRDAVRAACELWVWIPYTPPTRASWGCVQRSTPSGAPSSSRPSAGAEAADVGW
jgi:hypothetical protein